MDSSGEGAPNGPGAASAAAINPAPEGHETTVYFVREVVALIFVAIWVGVTIYDFVTAGKLVPFWFHACGVGVLSYALGLNVAELTAFKRPKRPRASNIREAAGAVRERVSTAAEEIAG